MMSSTTVTTQNVSTASFPHPLDQLSAAETSVARGVILAARGGNVAIKFRSIFLEEPLKKELSQFLDLEHAGQLNNNLQRPTRLAKVQYDVVHGSKGPEYMESVVDVVTKNEVNQRVVEKVHQSGLTT
jgi:primary-amine oxidase